jgi:molybdopterin synthase catalytic subunit
MQEKKIKNVFIHGAISPDKIANSIAHHQAKTNIGAHDIFLGQVRADSIDGKKVKAIDYSAYEEMANQVFHEIRETTFSKFDLTCMHIYHSKGIVKAGELCLFVFTSSAHRNQAMDACRYVVEEIKSKVPVFGKEIFDDESHQWKKNS